MERQKIASFTGLRFIMIMVIVVSHFEFLEQVESFGRFYTTYLHNATFAVDFFFLLSGFGMMLGNLWRINDKDLKFPKISESLSYGINHVKKIYPVYLATILFGLLAQTAHAVYNEKFSFGFICKEVIKLVVHLPILQSATGMMTFTHAFNGVTWFLSALFCIYLVSPFLMYCLRKISKSVRVDFLLLLIEFVAILALAYLFGAIELKLQNIHGIEHLSVNNLVYGSPYRRVFYVLSGMTLSNMYSKLRLKEISVSKSLFTVLEITISMLVVIYFFMRNSLPNTHFYYKYLIDIFLCSCFMFIFAFDSGCISKFLEKNKMQELGNLSMYIFLIHYPIRIYFGWFFEKYFEQTLLNCFIFIVFILISTFILSYVAASLSKPKSIRMSKL